MKKTKIVATIGPASWDEATLRALFAEGVNVCRLNFSHGDHKSHKETMDRIKKVREEMNLPVALMLDTKGPEIRTATFKEGEATLSEGAAFALYADEQEGDETGVSIPTTVFTKTWRRVRSSCWTTGLWPLKLWASKIRPSTRKF